MSPHLSRTARVGDIIWLPHVEVIKANNMWPTLPFDAGCLEHPMVLLSLPTTNLNAEATLLTSFNKVPFEEYTTIYPHFRATRIPIHPAPAHPDNNSLLRQESGCLPLDRATYVQTHETQSIPKGILDLCTTRGTQRLSQDSIKQVLLALDEEGATPTNAANITNPREQGLFFSPRKAREEVPATPSKRRSMESSWRKPAHKRATSAPTDLKSWRRDNLETEPVPQKRKSLLELSSWRRNDPTAALR